MDHPPIGVSKLFVNGKLVVEIRPRGACALIVRHAVELFGVCLDGIVPDAVSPTRSTLEAVISIFVPNVLFKLSSREARLTVSPIRSKVRRSSP